MTLSIENINIVVDSSLREKFNGLDDGLDRHPMGCYNCDDKLYIWVYLRATNTFYLFEQIK